MLEKVPKISPQALREVEAALKTYVDEIVAADLTEATKMCMLTTQRISFVGPS